MLERQSLQQMVLGKLDIHMQKKEDRPLANTEHKNSPEDLNVRPKTIKLLEKETLGQTNKRNRRQEGKTGKRPDRGHCQERGKKSHREG